MEGGPFITMCCRRCWSRETHFDDLCKEKMRLELRMFRINEERAEFWHRGEFFLGIHRELRCLYTSAIFLDRYFAVVVSDE